MSHNYAKLLISGGSAGPVNSLHNIDVACEASSSRAAGGAQTARFCAFFRQTIKKEGQKTYFSRGRKRGSNRHLPAGLFLQRRAIHPGSRRTTPGARGCLADDAPSRSSEGCARLDHRLHAGAAAFDFCARLAHRSPAAIGQDLGRPGSFAIRCGGTGKTARQVRRANSQAGSSRHLCSAAEPPCGQRIGPAVAECAKRPSVDFGSCLPGWFPVQFRRIAPAIVTPVWRFRVALRREHRLVRRRLPL